VAFRLTVNKFAVSADQRRAVMLAATGHLLASGDGLGIIAPAFDLHNAALRWFLARQRFVVQTDF
jgi:hypothetical protein